jgi:hypothetical protein
VSIAGSSGLCRERGHMKLRLGHRCVNRVPIGWVLVLSLLSAIPALISAQGASAPKSPKEVLQAYRRMDTAGERLTASGWYRASRFFVKPGRPPKRYVLAVTDGERVTDPDPWFKGGKNRVQILVVCSQVGQIDSWGHFTSVVLPNLIDPSGHLARQPVTPEMYGPAPVFRIYDLVLTDAHWEFTPERENLREVKGPPEWRIETFEFEPCVTIEVAIRYLTRVRDESSSEIIKRNANKSIATLRRLFKE